MQKNPADVIMKRLSSALNDYKIQTAVAVTSLFIILFIVAFGKASFNDFWWHLAIGKWMFVNGSFLKQEIFSLAFEGKEWLNNTWLYDGLIYLIHKATGFWGLNILRLVVFIGTYWLLYKASSIKYKIPVVFGTAVLLFTIPMIRNFYRPEILSPLFVAAYLFILYNFQYRKSYLIYLIPILELIWVNSHGGFPVGIILIGIFFGSELLRSIISYKNNFSAMLMERPQIKTYFGVLAASVLATLINPYGYKLYTFVINMLADQETLTFVAEWSPLSWTVFLDANLNSRLAFVLIGWLALFLLIFMITRIWRQSYKVIPFLKYFQYEDVLIFSFFLLSAIKYVRGMHVFTIVAAVLVLKNLPNWPRLYKTVTKGIIFNPILLLIILTFTVVHYEKLTLNTGPTSQQQPIESISFIKENKIKGNYINKYADGGNLIWLLYPEYKIFMDGRSANVYDTSYYWYYRHLSSDDIRNKLIKDYNINFAIIPHSWNLADELEESGEWKLVFFDNHSSVYLLDNEANQELIEKYKYDLLSPTISTERIETICPNPDQLNLLQSEINRNFKELTSPLNSSRVTAIIATTCEVDNNYLAEAEKLIKAASGLEPRNPEHYHNLASIQLKLDKNEEALSNFQQSMKISKNKQNATGYAIALHNLARYKKADQAFKKVLKVPGNFPKEYYQIYGRTLYQVDKNAKAIDMLNRYVDIIDKEKITAQDYLDLSVSYNDNEQPDEAAEYLAKALELDPTIKPDAYEIKK
jgi:tetratricopeptide (TPR) repeat protein